MADGVEFRFDLPDFKRQLEEFGKDFELKTVKAGALAAGKVFRAAAIAAAPVLRTASKRRSPGVLQRSIYVAFNRRNSNPGQVAYVVSFKKRKVSGGDPFYGRFLESGWIPRGPGQKLRGGVRRRQEQRQKLVASGKRKRTEFAFLLPAFNRTKDAALAAFNKKIEERISQENRKQLNANRRQLSASVKEFLAG